MENRMIDDDALGRIMVRVNARARRMIFRYQDGAFTCTVPPYVSIDEVRRTAHLRCNELLRLKERDMQRAGSDVFGPESRIDAEGFVFRCKLDDKCCRQVCYNAEGVTFIYHSDENWASPQLQTTLRELVASYLRLHAYEILPPRLDELSKQRGLHYNRLTLRKSKSRWGSCTAEGNISLSIYLALLPSHLRDYIMHHELTHLLEMNHGPRFHALLDEAVGGRSQALSREMKQYAPSLRLQ